MFPTESDDDEDKFVLSLKKKKIHTSKQKKQKKNPMHSLLWVTYLPCFSILTEFFKC